MSAAGCVRYVQTWPAIGLLIVLADLFPTCSFAQQFPYTAYITAADALIRSGPGNEYYATDRLVCGTAVEVYEHLEGKFAAIRPPDQSFSWVPLAAVDVDETSDVGVIRQDVKTIVGSLLAEDPHNVEYVTLIPGDTVVILGQSTIQLDGDESTPCYAVEPPSGEFRWIELDALSVEKPEKDDNAMARLSDGDSRSNKDRQSRDRSWQTKVKLAQFVDEQTPVGESTISEDGPTQELSTVNAPALINSHDTHGESPPYGPSTPGSPAPAPRSPESGSTGPTPAFELMAPPDESLTMPVPSRRPSETVKPTLDADGIWSSKTIDRQSRASNSTIELPSLVRSTHPLGPIAKQRLGQELLDIELQLTKQVCQTPATWRLFELHSRAQAVIDASDDPAQRLMAQNILAKIAQFEDVRRRQVTIVARNDNPNANTRLAESNASDPLDSQYDGTGYLMPVVTEHADMPKYVLTDEEGNIKQFVSPKPGVNLKRFEQQRVAILGAQGYLPSYNQPHLMAERVITLDKVR